MTAFVPQFLGVHGIANRRQQTSLDMHYDGKIDKLNRQYWA